MPKPDMQTPNWQIFAVALSLVRHALWAVSKLPEDEKQRDLVRWQVERLYVRLYASGDRDEAEKIKRLIEWYDNGAVVDDSIGVVFSESDT